MHPGSLLLPTPHEVCLTGGEVALPPALTAQIEAAVRTPADLQAGARIGSVRLEHDHAMPREAYRLIVQVPDAARICAVAHASCAAGWRHALRTLRQWMRRHDGPVACVRISDAPAFSTRGVMLDVSRDRVPTMDHLREVIDLIGSLKFNHLQLYTEHTFAYAGHEDVWADASPITPDELRELDAYGRARGVELAANQNCFGHLASWLKLPRYRHLAEIEGDGAWKFLHWERRGPFSLCPVEPLAAEFVDDLLGQLLPCVSGPLVNIGCDETFDVGWGRSRAQAELRGNGDAQAGRVALYFDFVSRVARSCARHGKRPMMWADIALSHPGSLPLMPEGMIGLAWWYEPTDKFEQWCSLLREHGHEAWVCPGTSSWRSFTGRTSERRANIADAAEQGRRAGATGLLACDWGDLGHRQQWPITLAALAQSAEAAWSPGTARAFDPRCASLHVFGAKADPEQRLGHWLDQLGDADLHIRRAVKLTNASALFNDLHPPVPAALGPGERAIKAYAPQWAEARDRLTALATTRPRIDDPLLRDEINHTLDVALFAADHALWARESPKRPDSAFPPPHPPTDLRRRAQAILAEHRRLWPFRSRPGGLPHADSYYRQVIDGLTAHLA